MRVVRLAAVASLLALTALGCTRGERERVAAPDPAAGSKQEPRVVEARLIEGPDLARAVSLASSHPLVQRAFLESADPALTPAPGLAIQAVGTMGDGSRLRVTLLPYHHPGDGTYASFLTLIERDGRVLVTPWEYIQGRIPTVLEAGYEPIDFFGTRAWVRQADGYVAGAGRGPQGVAQRFKFPKFATCLAEYAPPLCAVGATVGGTMGAPTAVGAPAAAAIGCGVGVGIAVIGCSYEAFK